jgi:hypothetical protein
VAQDRGRWGALVNTVMNFRFPLNVGKLWSSCTTGGLSMERSRTEAVVYWGCAVAKPRIRSVFNASNCSESPDHALLLKYRLVRIRQFAAGSPVF